MRRIKFSQFAMAHVAVLCLCGCGQLQQGWETPWGKDSLYTGAEIETKEIASQEYRSKVLAAAICASNISLERHDTQNGVTRKRRIHLHPKEQETLRMLLYKATYHPPKNDTRLHPTAPATEWTELVMTDRQGKCLYHGTVQLCPESLVSKDGYAPGAYLALSDENYRSWKRIIHRENTPPTVQEHEAATQQHRQAVKDLYALLRNCKTAEVCTLSNMFTAVWMRKLSPAETQKLCSLLRQCKPLAFLGNIPGLRVHNTTIFFYDAAGKTIGQFDAQAVTDADTARNQQHCTEQESMYLPKQEYKIFSQLIQPISNWHKEPHMPQRFGTR